MRVSIVRPGVASHALDRIESALIDYAPDHVRFVKPRFHPDLAVIFVIGRLNQVTTLVKEFKRYALIQLCVRSTQKPSTFDWIDLWTNAQAVWSYYNLPMLCEEDGMNYSPFNFYRAPLGVDPVFKAYDRPKEFLICTTGPHWLVEGVREAVTAAQHVGGQVFHLGPELRRKNVVCQTRVSDAALAVMYSRCSYVSGLRRVEGFELPAAEGLICGARPILFDREHYRYWYEDMAEYISEVPRPATVEAIEAVFRGAYRPVTVQERIHAQMRFDWKKSVEGFWERCE